MSETKITPDRLVLLIVDQAEGKLSGKTLLQKRAYFLSELLGIDLGYLPHYYGPYSPEVEDGLGRAKGLGFLEERTLRFGTVDEVGFEVRRYDFVLTEDGKQAVEYLKGQYPEECNRIRRCLERLAGAGDNGDYVSLSIAAKTHYVVSHEGSPMKAGDIRKRAANLGWKINEESIEKATSLLGKLHLLD